MKKKQYTIIGCGTGWGSGYNGTGRAPKTLFEWGLLDQLLSAGIDVTWQETVMPARLNPQFDARLDEAYPDVLIYSQGLEKVVRNCVTNSQRAPVFIGGDHSMAFGTWSGVVNGLDAHDEFGLIWVDAHMDAHTPVTSVQGKWGGHFHGMPLAHLLGHGDKDLCELGNPNIKINPKYLSLIGTRSYEPGEKELLDRLGVRVFYMEEIEKRGLKTCFEEAFERTNQASKGWGISLDLDVFDPSQAPAVGTPEKNGLRVDDFLHVIAQYAMDDGFKAFEIAEYNALKDSDDKITAQLVSQILKTIMR